MNSNNILLQPLNSDITESVQQNYNSQITLSHTYCLRRTCRGDHSESNNDFIISHHQIPVVLKKTMSACVSVCMLACL